MNRVYEKIEKTGPVKDHGIGLKCVVLCAGRGIRIGSGYAIKPKVMFEISEIPILSYVIDYWRRYTEDFVFVVGYKKEYVVEFVEKLSIRSQFVEQKQLKGIADALLHTEYAVTGRFIVVLGDCICRGDFSFPEDMIQGVGVWKTSDEKAIMNSYSVETENGLVSKVQEKPKVIVNNLCGMGYYFFDKRVFDYIRMTNPSSLRNEIEITDVIQNMIDAEEKITPILFSGRYLNINYPKDLITAKEFANPIYSALSKEIHV